MPVRVLDYNANLDKAAELALVSLTSTASSNITVGGPYELSTYRTGDFQLFGHCKFETSGDYIIELEKAGSKAWPRYCVIFRTLIRLRRSSNCNCNQLAKLLPDNG